MVKNTLKFIFSTTYWCWEFIDFFKVLSVVVTSCFLETDKFGSRCLVTDVMWTRSTTRACVCKRVNTSTLVFVLRTWRPPNVKGRWDSFLSQRRRDRHEPTIGELNNYIHTLLKTCSWKVMASSRVMGNFQPSIKQTTSASRTSNVVNMLTNLRWHFRKITFVEVRRNVREIVICVHTSVQGRWTFCLCGGILEDQTRPQKVTGLDDSCRYCIKKYVQSSRFFHSTHGHFWNSVDVRSGTHWGARSFYSYFTFHCRPDFLTKAARRLLSGLHEFSVERFCLKIKSSIELVLLLWVMHYPILSYNLWG